MEPLRVIEGLHNLFYSPLYVAMGLGVFEAEGFDVSMRTRRADEAITTVLREGQADIALTGIMRSFVDADAGQTDLPLSFIEVNSRDGFMLLSRQRLSPFRWQDLHGRTVLTYSEPPTPWMCLLRVLKEQGVDKERVTLSTDRQVPDALAAFEAGVGDFIELPEPLAERLIRARSAHFAAAMGSFTDDIPFTSFAATRSFLAEKRDIALRFARAIYSAQRWMADNDAAAIANLAASQLPDFPLDVLVTGVERYLRQSTWAKDPLLRREGFERFQNILRDGGLIKGNHRFEDLVDTGIAEEAMASANA